MATELNLCKCSLPLKPNGLGAIYCPHCDRNDCKGLASGCAACRILDDAVKQLALNTAP